MQADLATEDKKLKKMREEFKADRLVVAEQENKKLGE